ncbi:ATP-binding protein [Sphingobacterium deserti]|uniref:histidine kinase n=1 Tax=Sphingobacterium deserti TaxID=1229276 RepID=A0A0B8T560_9SPHI|nr:ATP-binding protein [Sphingobacterium deserti]KGE12584.1 PAS sensor protein [Sphingobacterium deserti]
MVNDQTNEQQRLAALHAYQILDTAIEEDYEELTELAAAICGTPIALISFVDKARQWFKSHKGLDVTETERSHSFCAHALLNPTDLMQVEDAQLDPRFKDNPLVTGEPHIAFYAGMPLVDDEGFALGTLCVIDRQPGKLDERQKTALKTLAKQVVNKLVLRKRLKDLEASNKHNLHLHGKSESSEKNLRLIIEQSPTAIIVFRGEDLLIEAVNPAMLTLLNQQSDIEGKILLEAIPELKGQPAYDLLNHIYQTGETIHRQEIAVMLNRSGKLERGYFNFTYAPLIENGQVTGIIDMAVEVTDQVNARLAIEESEHQMKQMVMNAAMGMCIIRGQDLVIEIANEPMLKIWTRTSEQVLGKRLTDVFPEVVGQPYPEMLRKVLNTGEPLAIPELTADIAETDGRINKIYIDFTYKPLRNSEGMPEAIIATVTDITDTVKARKLLEQSEISLKEANMELGSVNEEYMALNEELLTTNEQLLLAEESLMDLNERMNMAISAANLGTWSINLESDEMVITERTKELFGFRASDITTLDRVLQQVAETHREEVVTAINATINTGIPYNIEYPVVGFHDQQIRWLKAMGKRYTSVGGKAANHFSGTIMDITERKASDQLKQDFIGIVSHEMRSPLTALKGYVQILASRSKQSEDRFTADIASKAAGQVDRMTTLISGFLDVARADEGKIFLNKTNFDISNIFQIAEEESLATNHTHKFSFDVAESMFVKADRDKLEQVLINLINNAIKYSPNGSTIYISCTRREGWAHVQVTDEGMGIPPRDQAHIFERFYRVLARETENISGFGIGLYLCKEIIDGHSGRIGVESVPGQGSTFWFDVAID